MCFGDSSHPPQGTEQGRKRTENQKAHHLHKHKRDSKMQRNRAGVVVGVTGNGTQKARRFLGPSSRAARHVPPEGESGGRGELSRALFQKGVSLLSDEEDKQVVRWESQAQPWPCRGCTNLRMPRNQRPSHGHCECIDGEVGRKRRQRSDPKT